MITLINIKQREGFPDENGYLETVSNQVWADVSLKINKEIASPIIDITRRIVNQLKQGEYI